MKKKCFLPALVLGAAVLLCAAAAETREVRVAVFDFDVHSREDLSYVQSGIAALLPSRITVPGKIAVIDRYAVQSALTKKTLSPAEKRTLARTLKADFFISGSITKIGNTISIDAALVDMLDQEPPQPLVIQSTGLDDLIPEITKGAESIKAHILQGPPLPDHTPAQAAPPPLEPEPKAEAPVVPAPPAEKVAEEKPAAPPQLSETPLDEPEPEKPAMSKEPEEPAEPEKLRQQQASSGEPPAARPRRHTAPFEPAPYLSDTIKTEPFHVLTAADTNGDGQQELIAAGQEKICIFHVKQSSLQLSQELKTALGENIVTVDAADINGNGVDELYVSSFEGHYANSFVIEHGDAGYARTAEAQKWFFRVYRQADAGIKLIGQQADGTSPFSGTMYRFEWKNGELISRDEFLAPGGSGIFSFTEGDVDEDGSREYLAFSRGFLSSDYHLTVLSPTGRVKWKDQGNLGGAPTTFMKLLYSDDVEQRELIPLRIICDDFQKDGLLEVIVASNVKKGTGLMKNLGGYDQGTVHALRWDGSDLVSCWSSGLVHDYVADYIAADIDKDNRPELYILSVAPAGLFGKAHNTITAFKQAE